MTSPPWPLLVQAGTEAPRYCAALMNSKAFFKSIEQQSPWIYHPKNGRILPWPGSPRLISLQESAGCYRLTIPEGSSLEPYGPNPPVAANPDSRTIMNSSPPDSAILAKLAALIAERHREGPENSYTTHLFQEGAEKIRKKLGEEAVELLLAQNKDDIVYESADLLYHLLVLLEAMELPWSAVEAELARRYGT
ncbi:MAG: phosphoribosyl-ATP diphosphatase [Spirochaeta sp. LUC14_002_19_P3]|nr:MAG: phosphoribosyl-ATP diphosphatase [Spirochaeta sp. LUC14_002_19_P3]